MYQDSWAPALWPTMLFYKEQTLLEQEIVKAEKVKR